MAEEKNKDKASMAMEQFFEQLGGSVRDFMERSAETEISISDMVTKSQMDRVTAWQKAEKDSEKARTASEANLNELENVRKKSEVAAAALQTVHNDIATLSSGRLEMSKMIRSGIDDMQRNMAGSMAEGRNSARIDLERHRSELARQTSLANAAIAIKTEVMLKKVQGAGEAYATNRSSVVSASANMKVTDKVANKSEEISTLTEEVKKGNERETKRDNEKRTEQMAVMSDSNRRAMELFRAQLTAKSPERSWWDKVEIFSSAKAAETTTDTSSEPSESSSSAAANEKESSSSEDEGFLDKLSKASGDLNSMFSKGLSQVSDVVDATKSVGETAIIAHNVGSHLTGALSDFRQGVMADIVMNATKEDRLANYRPDKDKTEGLFKQYGGKMDTGIPWDLQEGEAATAVGNIRAARAVLAEHKQGALKADVARAIGNSLGAATEMLVGKHYETAFSKVAGGGLVTDEYAKDGNMRSGVELRTYAGGLGKEMGISNRAVYEDMVHQFKENIKAATTVGIGQDHAIEMQMAYQSERGNTTVMDRQTMLRLGEMKRALGENTMDVVKMAASYQKMGATTATLITAHHRMADSAERMGVSVNKLTAAMKDAATIGHLNSLSYMNGIRQMESMVTTSLSLKSNLGEITKAADKATNLQGALQMGAKLQLMGGSIAQFGGDPLALLNESRNNPEAFMKRMNKSLGNLGAVNTVTGEVNFSALDMDQIKFVAETTGQSVDNLKEQTVAAKRRGLLKKRFGLSEAESAWAESNAEWSEDGQVRVNGMGMAVFKNSGKMAEAMKANKEGRGYATDEAMNINALANAAAQGAKIDEHFKSATDHAEKVKQSVVQSMDSAAEYAKLNGITQQQAFANTMRVWVNTRQFFKNGGAINDDALVEATEGNLDYTGIMNPGDAMRQSVGSGTAVDFVAGGAGLMETIGPTMTAMGNLGSWFANGTGDMVGKVAGQDGFLRDLSDSLKELSKFIGESNTELKKVAENTGNTYKEAKKKTAEKKTSYNWYEPESNMTHSAGRR